MTSYPAAVLWDLDGTLIDTEPYWMECERQLVHSFGGQWTDDDAMAIVGFDLLTAAEVIRRRAGLPMEPRQIVDHLAAGVLTRIRRHVPWRPGARELLGALNAAGVPCGLVTMSWQDIASEVLLHLPPRSFQAVITGDMVDNGKPHAEPYRRAAAALGVDPVSCVAIEDSPTGARSAEAAGCVVLVVPSHVPVEPGPGRAIRRTLLGLTPEDLGEIVEATPLPAARHGDDGDDDERDEDRDRRTSGLWDLWQRVLAGGWRSLGALALVLVLIGVGVWWFAIRETVPPHRPGAFNVHTWVPYWTLDDAIPELDKRANVYHQVSPFWYQTYGIDTFEFARDAGDGAEAQAADFIAEARRRGVPIITSLYDRTDPGAMAAILADPVTRTQHVEAIANFAAVHNFQGIDIDYENFAFEDPRSTWAATRPNWVAFIQELSARLHADGRILTVSVPPVYDTGQTEDSGYWVYDYGAIAPYVDAIRIMAYDFSSTQPGPIAPLEWVRTIIEATSKAAGGPDKLVLGIPLYGRNWVISTTGTCPADAPTGTEPIFLSTVDDLIARRNATPVFDAVTGESSFTYQVGWPEAAPTCTQTRQVNYVDAEGARQRMQMSVDAGMLGVSLYAMGYEDDQIWDDIAAISATLTTEPPGADTAPTTVAPTTAAVTSVASTTAAPTTAAPTTVAASTTTAA